MPSRRTPCRSTCSPSSRSRPRCGPSRRAGSSRSTSRTGSSTSSRSSPRRPATSGSCRSSAPTCHRPSSTGLADASQWVIVGRSFADLAGLVEGDRWETAHADGTRPGPIGTATCWGRSGTDGGPPPYHGAIIRRHAECIDFMRSTRRSETPVGRAGDQDRRRAPGRRARRGRGAVRQPGATRRARSVRTAARPSAGARRSTTDVPDEQWNDWRWQLSEPGQRPRGDRADPRPDRRGARGPVGAGQVPRRHHALLPRA